MSSPSKGEEKGGKGGVEAKKSTDEAPKTTLELLEEDDEFQEFDIVTWEDTKVTEKVNNQLWKDDWDDDGVEDDFTEQLRAQIQASK